MHVRQMMSAIGAALLLLAPASALAGDNATVEAAVRIYFSDTPVLINIASCESQFHQFNSDGSVLHGGYKHTMVGIFQIAPLHIPDATAHGIDINTISGNMAYAKRLYDIYGTSPWLDSSPCWARMSQAIPQQLAIALPGAGSATAAAAAPDTDAKIAALQQQVAQLTAAVHALLSAHSTS